jgi:hypothetical protein
MATDRRGERQRTTELAEGCKASTVQGVRIVENGSDPRAIGSIPSPNPSKIGNFKDADPFVAWSDSKNEGTKGMTRIWRMHGRAALLGVRRR